MGGIFFTGVHPDPMGALTGSYSPTIHTPTKDEPCSCFVPDPQSSSGGHPDASPESPTSREQRQ